MEIAIAIYSFSFSFRLILSLSQFSRYPVKSKEERIKYFNPYPRENFLVYAHLKCLDRGVQAPGRHQLSHTLKTNSFLVVSPAPAFVWTCMHESVTSRKQRNLFWSPIIPSGFQTYTGYRRHPAIQSSSLVINLSSLVFYSKKGNQPQARQASPFCWKKTGDSLNVLQLGCDPPTGSESDWWHIYFPKNRSDLVKIIPLLTTWNGVRSNMTLTAYGECLR